MNVSIDLGRNRSSAGFRAWVRLHLVEPLGFSLEDRYLKRAGLDYWPLVDLVVHPDLEQTPFPSPADEAGLEEGPEKLGKDGHDLDAHASTNPSGRPRAKPGWW